MIKTMLLNTLKLGDQRREISKRKVKELQRKLEIKKLFKNEDSINRNIETNNGKMLMKNKT